MKEEAKLNFYSINKCGYYNFGKGDPEFGSVKNILQQLNEWAKRPDFTLESTCTYSTDNDEDDSLRTFCFDIIRNKKTGDFFLTTWNETPTTFGQVASVEADQPVGQADVKMNEIVEGTIPGYATYFWFMPEHDVFATVRFQHTFNGHRSLVKYLNGFLETHSPYAVKRFIDDDNIEVLGYRDNEKDEIEKLNPSFRSRLLRKGGEVDLIKQKCASIRNIIRKSTLNLEVEEEKSLATKMLEKMGIFQGCNGRQELSVKYNIPYTPTNDDISSIIENAFEEGLSWHNDVGFQFTGKSEVTWLSNSIIKRDFDLNVERENDEVVNLLSLGKQLSSQRQIVVNILNGAQ
ncbi:MAG: hypothetical protein PHZ02_14230 [Desulfocapsaceae bacterium]|nr:hypothetical protein [Desulfocapsaceae bacterium]